MDYSSSIHEADEAVGASPWGNSPTASPRHNRTNFTPAATDSPPFGFNPQPATLTPDPTVPEGFQRPGTAASASGTEGEDSTQNPSEPEESTAEYQPTSSQHDSLPEPAISEGHHHPPGQNVAPRQDQQPRKTAQPQYRLQAKITGLERTGKKDPILRFDVHVCLPSASSWSMVEANRSQTNLPRFRTTQYRDVRRMHSEFVKLADHLVSANPEAFVPACPPPVTSAGAGTDEDEMRVKALLQRWFNYVCSNEVLMRDDEMVLFVESDFGYSPLLKMKQPATGVRRKILKQFAPPPDDTPELAEARPVVKLFYLGSMDAGHKVDKLVKARRGTLMISLSAGYHLAHKKQAWDFQNLTME